MRWSRVDLLNCVGNQLEFCLIFERRQRWPSNISFIIIIYIGHVGAGHKRKDTTHLLAAGGADGADARCDIDDGGEVSHPAITDFQEDAAVYQGGERGMDTPAFI